MWIKASNGTKKFYDEDVLTEPIVFNDNGKVQVSRSEGDKLIKKYDFISQSKTEPTYKKNEVSS